MVALVLCVVFAALGSLPFAVAGAFRSPWAERRAAEVTERVLAEHGVQASYRVALLLWPVAVELRDIRVASSDGGSPVLTSSRASVRPRFFALLAGKLAIDQIEVDAPAIRLVVKDGQLQNLALKLPEQKQGGEEKPLRAPFSVFTVADAQVDLTIDGVHGTAREIDLDVTSDEDPEAGTSLEVAIRAGRSWVTRRRPLLAIKEPEEPVVAVDDDALCSVEGRFRVDQHALLVRRLSLRGAADLDAAPDSVPGCDLPAGDKRNVELSVHHLHVEWPRDKDDVWKLAGHARVRAPVELAHRLVRFPDTDGWVGADVDVRYGRDTTLPEVVGRVEAHDIKLERYRFAQFFQGDLELRQNVVRVPHASLGIADGVATFTDLTVEPLVRGVPMRTRLDVAHSNFTTLMANLGVSDHAHVAWDLRELHAPVIQGTILPLHMDGDFVAQTGNFLVFDRAADDPVRQRIIGIKETGIHAHVGIRQGALEFSSIHLTLPTGTVDGGFCSIGFHNELRVDVPKLKMDLVDLTPLATIPLAGQAEVSAHMSGVFNAPLLEADATIQNFVFGDMVLGDVSAGHASLSGLVLSLRDVKAGRGKSTYEMPSAVLNFGTGAALIMDAKVASEGLSVRDFLGTFKLDDDPRFAELDGLLRTQASLHLSLGGPEDTCGAGFLDLRASTHAQDLKLFGETFDDGDADFTYRWTDRLAGLDGADVDVRAMTLHKVHPHGRGEVLGVVLGSGTIRQGGGVNMSLVLQTLPLSRINSLGELAREGEGTVSGLLSVSGTLDDYTAQGDMDISPIRFRGAAFRSSTLHARLEESSVRGKPIGRTRCGRPVYPPFDKATYAQNLTTKTDLLLDGELFGGEVRLDGLHATRMGSSKVAGNVALRSLALGPVLQALEGTHEEDAQASSSSSPSTGLDGKLSGTVAIDHLDTADLAHAAVRVSPTELSLSRNGQTVELRTQNATIAVQNDELALPPLQFQLRSRDGLQGSCTVRGTVASLSSDPSLGLTAELAPIDLGVLAAIVPKVERSAGVLSGSLAVKGKLSSPAVAGNLDVRGAELGVHGWPSDLTDLNVDVVLDANEARIARATGKFAGGTVRVTGNAPLKGSSVGAVNAAITARDLHLSPAAGIAATVDADLDVTYGSKAAGSSSLPRVSGDVTLTSFEYTRPMNLEASAFGGVAKRTNVEVYDPSLDALSLDVLVKSRAPLRIRNNLVEVSLAIDSGAVVVTGTDQRFGLRGELKALPGGRFHLRANDFDVRQGVIRFEDATRIAPAVDVTAVTEYRRYSETTAAAGASAGTGTGGLWRISLHAYGDADNLRLDMTSDPPLSQEDIVLLLTIGMTRAEVDQLQAGSLGASAALEALATVSGADRAVKAAFPVIDDFRFGSAYSPQTGRTEPQVIVGKRLTDNLRASVATSVGEDEELRANVEWRLNKRLGIQAAYDNINDVSSSVIGNVGVDLRWHLEFR